ncbi:MAG: UDP-N-acetylmuramoyl-L-alanine--D-glutamate ligase [Bacillota bacterium]
MVLKDKKVLVVGLATSGIPTVNTLVTAGAYVTVNDIKSKDHLQEIMNELSRFEVEYILGRHPLDDEIEGFDLIVLSPGVPTDLPFIEKSRACGKEIIGELELAYQLCRGRFVAITGTNGKTTTTALTGEIFKNAKTETYVVGNIGVAAVSKALEASENAYMVTEVSSFQLESIKGFKPIISAVLNITPDHLNRHKTMDNYIDAKANIFKNQEAADKLVLNADDEIVYNLKKRTKSYVIPFSRKKVLDHGAFVLEHHIVVKEEGKAHQIICDVDELQIPGDHNLENALAAAAIAYWVGIDIQWIAYTLRSFKGVEHRIEFVDEIDGVQYINDSKGTNPDSSIAAIKAMRRPIVLIAGGMDKGSDFTDFINTFSNKVKHMILFGETAVKIKNTAEKCGFKHCILVKNLDEAVDVASKNALKGDVVLLSPACASWDMYKSFEQRGQHFKDCVKKIRRS